MAVEFSLSLLVVLVLGLRGTLTIDIMKLRRDPRLLGYSALSATSFALAHLCFIY